MDFCRQYQESFLLSSYTINISMLTRDENCVSPNFFNWCAKCFNCTPKKSRRFWQFWTSLRCSLKDSSVSCEMKAYQAAARKRWIKSPAEGACAQSLPVLNHMDSRLFCKWLWTATAQKIDEIHQQNRRRPRHHPRAQFAFIICFELSPTVA